MTASRELAAEARDQARPPVTFAAWWTLAVLFLFYVLSVLDRSIIAMLVEPIKADLSLTDTQMSLVLGPAFIVSYSLLGVPLGWLADRTSRRWVIFGGVIVWAASAAAGGLARTVGQLVVARAGVGAGEAALTPAAYSLLADNFPRHRLGLALAIYQSALKVGTALAYAGGGVLIHLAQGGFGGVAVLEDLRPWQVVLILTGLPGLLLSFLILTTREPRRTAPAAKEKASNLGEFLRSNFVLLALLMGGFGCIATASNAITSWVPAYMERRFEWRAIQFGPWLSVLSIATAASLLFKGALMDWLYSRGLKDAHVRFFTWLCISAFPGVAVLFWLPSPEAFLILYGVLQILTLTFLVFLAPAIQIFTPVNLRGQVTAAFLFAFSIIGAIGPVLVGVITDYALRDEQKLGVSLAIVFTVAVAAAIVLLRASLPHLRKVMEERDVANAPT